jgi:hypothetical protein
MHAELGILNEAYLDIVSARNDPQQARIGCGAVEAVIIATQQI